MKKFLIFFFIFSLSSSIFQPLFSKNKNLKDSLGCTNDLSKDFFLLGDNLPIKKIEIDTHKYRDWVVNNIKIITSNTRFVPNILKKYLQ